MQNHRHLGFTVQRKALNELPKVVLIRGQAPNKSGTEQMRTIWASDYAGYFRFGMVVFRNFFRQLCGNIRAIDGSTPPNSPARRCMTYVIAHGYSNDDDRGMVCNHGCRALIFHSGSKVFSRLGGQRLDQRIDAERSCVRLRFRLRLERQNQPVLAS